MERPAGSLLLADVVLPLPLADSFTYRLPAHLQGRVCEGGRVLVPFGAKKTYTAIVLRLYEGQWSEAQGRLRDIVQSLDVAPVLLPAQLRLWRWIADYYLCTLGEVYKAALPGGLKLEEAPRPRTVSCLRLSAAFFSQDRLNALFDELHRAPRQSDLLLRYLSLSQAAPALDARQPALLLAVPRAELMAGQSEAALKALRERGVLEVCECEEQALRRQEQEASDAPGTAAVLALSPLSEAQQRAYDQVCTAFAGRDICLLHGVTGSGKTEIYIRLIQDQLARGRQVLYLLPEIVLTAQLVERLRRVFGPRLGVYHSKYPDAERVGVWQRQLSDRPYDIVVGVRSSVFLPFRRLGLVIVDEEHETSFKQQDPAPRYHARNVALVLARQLGAKALLGTATPSLESYHNARTGRYALVSLSERYGRVQLPRIEVVDLRDRRRRKEMHGPFSTDLLRAMRQALERREQVILFQNRRGYAPQVECQTCGWNPRCTQCDVALTLHRDARRMTCHYCGASYAIPDRCPQCGGHELTTLGYGTERIQEVLARLLPQARVARMDLDTTRSRTAYERILDDFQQGRTDVLVGTQMVTKGLDFERVSLVGILNADTLFNMPDFRSYERAFQMLSQVAGRAGRRSSRGLVLLQTKSPSLPVVDQIVRADYSALYREQAEERQAFGYPPFTRLVYIVLKHRDPHTVQALAADMAAHLRRIFGHRVLGPDTPAVGRVQLLYLRKLVLKVELAASMSEARLRLRQLRHHLLCQPPYRSAHIVYDVDPV